MRYYVLSEGENPTRIFFKESLAKEEGKIYQDAYLDIFDGNGDKVEALKLVWNDEDKLERWTNEF